MSPTPITPIDAEIAGLPKRDRDAPPGKSGTDKPNWKEDQEQAEDRGKAGAGDGR